MRFINPIITGATVLLLTACSDTSTSTAIPEESTTSTSTHQYAGWEGKWVGVEGMFVEITSDAPGQYKLEMQSDLDSYGTYEGTDTPQGIEFTREGQIYTLQTGTGDETGLKYLTGKSECLIVKSGEGYCRD